LKNKDVDIFNYPEILTII